MTRLSSYADAVVVCGELETAPDDPNAVTTPTVIVEVLSDGTESYDRGAAWTITEGPVGERVPLRGLGGELSVDEVYADVTLSA